MDRLARNRRAVAGAAALLATAALGVTLLATLKTHPLDLPLGMAALRFDEPRWLALVSCAPLVLAVALASRTDFSRARRLWQAAARIAFLSVLAAALAGPALRQDRQALSIVTLIDVSASVTDGQLADQRAFLDGALRQAAAQTPPATVRVVRFAAAPEELPEGAGAARIAGGGDDTDLGAALSLGLGLLEPGRVPRLLVLSDGRATTGDALTEAQRAAQRRVRILWRSPGGTEQDVAVLDLSAPDEVRPRASFELEIRLLATHAGSARLSLTRDGQPHPSVAERTVTFGAGVTTIRWETRLEKPGVAIYRAQLLVADGNGRTENDAGIVAIAPRPRPRVLVVEGAGASGGALLRALSAEGFEGQVLPARALRGPGIERFSSNDLVVLADVGVATLPPAVQDALDRFVRDGGGLVVSGGPDSFGRSGPAGARLEQLLPVHHDPTDRREEATLALALVIDRSGSMSGPKMDLTKEAARGTAQMLSPEDLISVVVFDSQAHPVVRLQPASNRQRILSDIAQIRASGGTNILPGLREAFEQLVPARAKKKHVILLSDGQSPYDSIPELVDDAVAAQITVSAVGVGEGADQTLLQMIAMRGGGRFYHTRDPASIPQIFTRETSEVSSSSAVEARTALRATKRADMLRGLDIDSAPSLGGYARTRLRREAELLIATSDGDPLLARWQVGLGQVIAWTSDLGGRWSADLARWPQFPKLWAQIGRSSMRRGAANQFPMAVRLHGNRAHVSISAVGGDGGALGGLRGTLEVVDIPAGAAVPGPARSLPLREVGDGDYEAEIATPGPGSLLLAATLVSAPGDRLIGAAHGRVALPFGRELLPVAPGTSTGTALLAQLAERSGGRAVVNPHEVFDAGSDRVSATRPVRAPLLLVAILLFLADVTIRRVKFPRL